MKALTTLILALAVPLGTLSATITLYEVAFPSPTGTSGPEISQGATTSFSPIGVGADGKTTYIEEVAVTEGVLIFDSTSTTTVISSQSPLLKTYTVVEDSSGFMKHGELEDEGPFTTTVDRETMSCDFQGTTAGSCVDVVKLPPPVNLLSTSFTGSLIPVYTLTETASIPGPTQTQTQTSGALATRGGIGTWSMGHSIGLVLSTWGFCMLFL